MTTDSEKTTGGILHPVVAERIRGLEVALTDATARAERLQGERDRLIEAWPEYGFNVEPQPLVWRDPDGDMPHPWAHGTEKSWRWKHDTKAAAVRAAANLDAPATGEGRG